MKLCVLGESPFTRAVRRKAEKLGVTCVDDPTGVPVIVDTEVYPGMPFIEKWQDIDRTYYDGLSCCAEAVLETLGDVSGLHVCVVGRGHAVQGLAEILLDRDATVTVCHSKTQNLRMATLAADILVVAAPIEPWPVIDKVVVDVAGTFGGIKVFGLTTDIIMRRVMNR